MMVISECGNSSFTAKWVSACVPVALISPLSVLCLVVPRGPTWVVTAISVVSVMMGEVECLVMLPVETPDGFVRGREPEMGVLAGKMASVMESSVVAPRGPAHWP